MKNCPYRSESLFVFDDLDKISRLKLLLKCMYQHGFLVFLKTYCRLKNFGRNQDFDDYLNDDKLMLDVIRTCF